MADKQVKARIQIKSDTDANFGKATFVPKKGEPIYYETSKYLKIGDGSTAVNSLPFLTSPNADKLDGYHATSFVKSTGNITASGYNKYAIVSKSNTNVFPYNKIAHIEGTSSWYDGAMLLYITADYNGGGFGLLRVSMRSQDQTATTSGYQYAMAEAKWLVRGGLGASKIIVCYNNVKAAWNADVFLITSGAYECYSINQLEAGNRGAVTGTTWTLISASEQANSTSASVNNKNCYSTLAAAGTYTNTIYSADAGYVQSAGSASSATNASYTGYLGTSTSNYSKSSLDTALGNKQDTLSATGNYTVGTIAAATGSFINITSIATTSHSGSVGESSKTFLNAYVDNYNAGNTTYLDGSITKKSGTSTYTLTLPSSTGTLATQTWVTDKGYTTNTGTMKGIKFSVDQGEEDTVNDSNGYVTINLNPGSNVNISKTAGADGIMSYTISATNTTYGVATATSNGLMSSADKSAFDSMTKVTYSYDSTSGTLTISEAS